MNEPVSSTPVPDSKYASRKFILALLALALGTWMRFQGVLSDEATLSLMATAVLGYQGANVATAYFEGKKP
jgi:hypothetical protein